MTNPQPKAKTMKKAETITYMSRLSTVNLLVREIADLDPGFELGMNPADLSYDELTDLMGYLVGVYNGRLESEGGR